MRNIKIDKIVFNIVNTNCKDRGQRTTTDRDKLADADKDILKQGEPPHGFLEDIIHSLQIVQSKLKQFFFSLRFSAQVHCIDEVRVRRKGKQAIKQTKQVNKPTNRFPAFRI